MKISFGLNTKLYRLVLIVSFFLYKISLFCKADTFFYLRIRCNNLENNKSKSITNKAIIKESTITTTVVANKSRGFAQETFFNSLTTLSKYSLIFLNSVILYPILFSNLQAWRDLNPHPPDLESGALAVGATGLFNWSCKISNCIF